MPGLNLYTGNRLETLQLKLARQLSQNPLPPLQKEIVVVQSKGMQRWLNLEIARQNRICAHMEYLFPKAFVYNLFRQVADLPENSPFAPEILTWKILKTLPGLIETSEFETLKNYVKDDISGLKKFKLAEKIASLFDRYIILRPEMVTCWDRGKNPFADIFEESRWQAVLWKRLIDDESSTTGPHHHAALKNVFLEARARDLDLPPRVSVFGISTLPPFYIDIFLKIARRVEVDIYYLNPCREYWEYAYSKKQIARFTKEGFSDDDQYYESGNSLLASMGNAGREFFSLLLSSIGETGEDLFFDPGDRTLLSSVQSDILNLRQREKGASPFAAPSDTSIRVHACHSRSREVEILHDQLLDLFANDPDLLPTDIVVMMPDVTAYAPLIQALFDTREHESKQIPYSIADTHIRSSNILADTFLAILSLAGKRYRAPAVLDILEAVPVRKRFGITEDDLELIKGWVKATGIRWGIDGRYREGLGLPGFHENTWLFGLDRMLLGYALPPDERLNLFGDIFPYGEIEGDSVRVLGAFAKFAQALFACCESLGHTRSPAHWADRLSRVLVDFFINDETTADDISQIRDTLTDAGLSGFTELAGFNGAITIDVIRAYLENRIAGDSLSFGFISSGVTFCTLLPMRSIPFKVVYMLGMNDGDYPRTGQSPGFDLMEKRRRLCDWSKRHEDRYLFLESILSARQTLIISYVGRDLKDNSDLPPSVLVSELLDYLAQAFEADEGRNLTDRLLTRHPLQPFSPLYFQGIGKLFSYSEQNCRAAQQSLELDRADSRFPGRGLPPPTGSQWNTIHIDRFCRFFYNPAEFLTRQRLHVNFGVDESGTPEEREPFELDALQAYSIKNELADIFLGNRETGSFFDVLRASGRIPHGLIGKAGFAGYQDEVRQFVSSVKPHINGERVDPPAIRLQLGNDAETTLYGSLSDIFPGGQLFYRCATIKVKDLLRAWIHHLVLNAHSDFKKGRPTTLIGTDKAMTFTKMGRSKADSVLGKLANLYLDGLQSPLCFFPQTSYAYARAIAVEEQPVDRALNAARRIWYPGHYSGEGEDIYIRKSFGNDLPESRAFQATALEVFGPLFAALTEEN